ncbi:MAG: threonine--tRNA ligase [Armatimonadota bacterium]
MSENNNGGCCCGDGYPLSTMRHSAAHVMAHAVQDLWPGVKIAMGPPIDDGFYYDFDKDEPFSPEDFEKIEARMKQIVKEARPFEYRIISKEEGAEVFKGQPYKLEILQDIPDGDPVTTYSEGDFTDLCRGPHVNNAGEVKAFKLLSIAGAYFKGDAKRPMLQRLYATAWESKEDLQAYLERLEEARKRDHKRLGKELELFTIIPEIGPGLPVWLPKGATVRRILEEYILGQERKHGYDHVYTPIIANLELYKTSGHWQHYHESMFPPMQFDNEQVVLRPMNCPHHFMMYKQKVHSYRELPIRIAELGNMFRYEQSGELTGLSRVRSMTLNDAHIFCRPEQIKDEVKGVLLLIEEAYQKLGFTDYWYRLSLGDREDTEKYVENPEMWETSERELAEVLDELGVEYKAMKGEAAFYGPKIDVQVPNVMGKDETISTIQLDFHMPDRFELEYVGEDSQPHRPVCIHRGVISTMERIMAFLIERYAGAFPLWLAPVQAIVLPIADRHKEYGQTVTDQLNAEGFRVKLDTRNEKTGYKIREAQMQKIPYMLIVGDREQESEGVSIRSREAGDLGAKPVTEFIGQLRDELQQTGTDKATDTASFL